MSSESCCDKIEKFFSCCVKEKPPAENRVLEAPSRIFNHQATSQVRGGSMALDHYKKRSTQAQKKEYKWKVVQGSYIYQDKTCSICLAENANIMLECNHFFHKPCLWIWYANHRSCPNCRSITKTLDVFCEMCFFEYYSSFIEDQMKEKSIDSFGLPITKTCQSCSMDEERRFRESFIIDTSKLR